VTPHAPTKVIHLGLLENDSLLLLPLVGNGSAERAGEFSLVQERLCENRVRYRQQIVALGEEAEAVDRDIQVPIRALLDPF